MRITIENLVLSNFKGLSKSTLPLRNKNAVLSGKNGKGKTTVYDAVQWLLRGKDSENHPEKGKGAFGVRPIDEENNPIGGLTVKVEGVLNFDNREPMALRKEQTEKIIKGKKVGYEFSYWINDVPTQATTYTKELEKLFPSEQFEILTNLKYFIDTMHHSDRRKILLNMAGTIAEPEGFNNLKAELKRTQRTIEQQKKRVNTLKKGYEEEQFAIPPKLDEVHRSVGQYKPESKETLEANRAQIRADIDALEAERKKILSDEHERQLRLEIINKLRIQLSERQASLVVDTSNSATLLEERKTIEHKLADAEAVVSQYQNKIREFTTKKTTEETILKSKALALDKIRKDHQKLLEEDIVTTCPTCGQPLPEDKIQEIRTERKQKLAELNDDGIEQKQIVEKQRELISQVDMQVGSAKSMLKEAEKKLQILNDSSQKRLAEIKSELEDCKAPDPNKDPQYLAIKEKLEKAEKALGPSGANAIEILEIKRKSKQNTLQQINETLAQSDRLKADKERIAELEQDNKRLAQAIADCDKQLEEISDYTKAENILIEKTVNQKFKHVRFRLFKQLLNGEIDDQVCDAMLNGKTYIDMSDGERIFSGVDIVNTLSEYYNLFPPLFIDHAESITLPIETNTQTILLCAVKGQELKLEVED
jgi:DNA repair exonuclease SbcCD ATPase subunit